MNTLGSFAKMVPGDIWSIETKTLGAMCLFIKNSFVLKGSEFAVIPDMYC